MSILISQQLGVLNGNFVFPASNVKFGAQNQSIPQLNPGGACPGEISAIATGQGTLVDLTTLPVGAGGGWCVFLNPQPAGGSTVTWGVDDGSGNLEPVGDMLPGEYAGPFRTSASQNKYRFKSSSGTVGVLPFFFTP